MAYYAIQWTYGRACNEDGNRCGSYKRFSRKTDRDAWVNNGNPYVSNPGSREEIPANDREIRRLNRADNCPYTGWRGQEV